ncbi:unnamed protein product [Prunus armeniaca]
MDTERFDTSVPLWILHVDGSANQQGCGADLVLTTPDGSKIEYALRFNFRTSNNEAEYEALLAGLRLAKSMSARQISIHSDSQLIMNQITADFAAKDASMSPYLSAAHQLLQKFQAYEIRQIPRSENSHADALSRLASAINDKVGRKVPVEILSQPSTTTADVCTIRYEDTWMSPIYAFLTTETLPTDKSQARKLRYRSARYTVINDVLYKRGYTTPYLKCLTKEQGDYILREVHSGICGDHSGSRSLAHKVFRQGYFWPTLHQDANTLVRKCDKCQRFGIVPHIPAEPLSPIVSPWPFAQWGLDLIGPMPEGKGQVKYVVVAVDYFTKWVEAKALATITATRIEDFIWTNICCRFGIPYAIVTDNGRQFDLEVFREFCTRLKINLFFASSAHPQSNGQVEAMNKIVKKLLKRQLDKAKGAWPEKLPEALWAIRTSYRTATGETPFSMAFGSEAVVPVEIGEPSARRTPSTSQPSERSLQATCLSVLGLQGQIPLLPNRRLGNAESLFGNQESHGRNPRTFLGGTLRNHWYPAIGDLSTQRLQRKDPRSSLECRAFEVLFQMKSPSLRQGYGGGPKAFGLSTNTAFGIIAFPSQRRVLNCKTHPKLYLCLR